jgi:hypothetical protein
VSKRFEMTRSEVERRRVLSERASYGRITISVLGGMLGTRDPAYLKQILAKFIGHQAPQDRMLTDTLSTNFKSDIEQTERH